MRLLISATLIFLISFNTYTQDCYKADWVKAFGGSSLYNGIIDGDRLPDGSFVLLGTYGSSILTLDTFNLNPAGSYNVFLARVDTTGHFIDARRIAYCSGGYLVPTALDAGLDGRIHITGYYQSSSAFINDSALATTSRERVFAASYDSDLSFRWKKESAWMSADCRAYDVSGGPDGGVFICGNFEDNAFKIDDFVAENYGGWNMWREDAFWVKFDSSGNVQLLQSMGTSHSDGALTITADSNGDAIITGSSNASSTEFRFADNYAVPGSAFDYGFFIGKIDGSSGDCLWGNMGGGLFQYSKIYSYDACRGENNSIYVTGHIQGTVSLPPNSYSAYDADGFLAKFDSNGNSLWLKVIGGQNSNEYGVDCSYHNGQVAVTGKLFSNQTYVGDFPLYSTLSGQGFDAFNAMFGEDGSVIWARGNNSSYSSDFYPACVLIDDAGNQLYWGSFKGSQLWYPHTLNNTSSNPKIFLAKFAPSAAVPSLLVSAGPDKSTTCSTYVNLSGSVTPSSASFGWYPNLGFYGNNDKTPNVFPVKSTNYILYGWYQGCVYKDTVNVDVTNYNSLAVSASGNPNFCRGGSTNLSASSSTPGVSYSWTPAVGLSADTGTNITVNPPYPVNYVVTAKAGACEASDTIQVVPQELPYINMPKQDYYSPYYRYHLCQGNAEVVNLGSPLNTYTVTTPAIISSANNNIVTLNGTQSGLFNVTATNAFGCTNQDVVNIVIHNNLQPPPINGVVKNRTACDGDSLQLVISLTNTIVYPFQYSWYAGWEVDKGNGNGWQAISIWDKEYDIYNVSYGWPTSSMYTTLRIPTVKSEMDGYKYRCWLKDYCSPISYSNAGMISIGPKITKHPQSLSLCEGETDSISVNSSSSSVSYFWQILQNGSWDTLHNQAGVMHTNGRFLRFENVAPSLDSTIVRCRMEGCSPQAYVYTDSAIITVIRQPQILWQSMDDSVCEGDMDSIMVITNSGPYTYQWYQNSNPMTYNTSSYCCFNSNKLKFTPVYLYQNNYTYKLRIRNTQCAYDTFSIPVHFNVTPSSGASWAGGNLILCEDDMPLTLSGGSPAGGTYSGPGVIGNTFDPAIAGIGAHTIYYGYSGPTGTCSDSASRMFIVNPKPQMSWVGGLKEYCLNDAPISLSGALPSGGTYSGPGVNNNIFSPTVAGPGNHWITYTYLDLLLTCSDTILRQISVLDLPPVYWPGGDTDLCINQMPFPLSGGSPAGGTYYGTGVVSGIFDPLISGAGIHSLEYQWLDTSTSCTGTSQAVIGINSLPLINWYGDTSVCLNSGAFTLGGASPTGGYYKGNAVAGGQFSPLTAGIGYDTVWYVYTDAAMLCTDSVMAEIYVDPCVGIGEMSSACWIVWQKDKSIRIKRALSSDETMHVSLLNSLGQRIIRDPGCHTSAVCNIDVARLQPGLYYLLLEAGDTRETRKIILH